MNQSAEKIQQLKTELETARATFAQLRNAKNASAVKCLEIALRVRGVSA